MPTASSLGRADVVSGTLAVDSHDAHVLFDSGASFSFISLDFARRVNISSHKISQSVHVSSPGGLISSSVVCLGCTISIDGDDFVANLIVIPLPVFDAVLGMDWLHRYRAVISCFWKTITLEVPSGHIITFSSKCTSSILTHDGKSLPWSSSCEEWLSLEPC